MYMQEKGFQIGSPFLMALFLSTSYFVILTLLFYVNPKPV